MTTDKIAGRVIEAKGFDAADAALRKANQRASTDDHAIVQEARHGRTDRVRARSEVEIGGTGAEITLSPAPIDAALPQRALLIECRGQVNPA
jgi:hypothetical protein